jgi:hypothetical protein
MPPGPAVPPFLGERYREAAYATWARSLNQMYNNARTYPYPAVFYNQVGSKINFIQQDIQLLAVSPFYERRTLIPSYDFKFQVNFATADPFHLVSIRPRVVPFVRSLNFLLENAAIG